MKIQKSITLIDEYLQELNLNGTAKTTLRQTRPILVRLNEFKPVAKCTADDLKTFIGELQKSGICLNTIAFYKSRIKGFFIWYEKPEIISWIKIKKEKTFFDPAELVTQQELELMLKAAWHPRDKCYIALLSETGARPQELLNLNIEDVRETEYGMEVRIPQREGSKTGFRPIPIIDAVQYVKMWLNQYPGPATPEKPLFLNFDRVKQFQRLGYRGIEYRIRKIAKAAGITRRFHCYLFRHTALTSMAKEHYNESLIRKKAGWTAGSKMPEVYINLCNEDLTNAVLQKHGLRHIQQASPTIALTRECATCHKQIPIEAQYCENCSKHQDLSSTVKKLLVENQATATRMDILEKEHEKVIKYFEERKHQTYEDLVEAIKKEPKYLFLLKKYEELDRLKESEYNARIRTK